MKVLVVKFHDREETNDPVAVAVYGGRHQKEAERKAFLDNAPDFADENEETDGFWGITIDQMATKDWDFLVGHVADRDGHMVIYSEWVEVQ